MKTTTTTEEMTSFLAKCVAGASMYEVAKAIDPTLSEEQMHYFQARMKVKLKGGIGSPYAAAGEVLVEEAPVSVIAALVLFGHAAFLYGKNVTEHDKISTMMEQMDSLMAFNKSLKENFKNDKFNEQKGNV